MTEGDIFCLGMQIVHEAYFRVTAREPVANLQYSGRTFDIATVPNQSVLAKVVSCCTLLES